MAITKPLIFDSITISDVGGGNPVSYATHLVDSAEVNPEPTSTMIDDGQTLIDFYDVTFQVDLYDDDLLADARIRSSGGDAITRAQIAFTKSSGATTLTIEDVIINGNRVFDGNRVKIRLSGSKRAVAIDDTVAVS